MEVTNTLRFCAPTNALWDRAAAEAQTGRCWGLLEGETANTFDGTYLALLPHSTTSLQDSSDPPHSNFENVLHPLLFDQELI